MTEARNGWTGGQYSLYRSILGAFLLAHFAALLPWCAEVFSDRGVLPAAASPFLRLFPNILILSDAPAVVASLVALGALASIFLMAGSHDRGAAIAIAYVLACLFGRNPLILNPSLPFLGWLLLVHAFLPPAPFGSWAARGRLDPRGGWHLPGALHAAAWIVASLGYTYSGYAKLVSPSWVDGTAMTRVLMNPLARPSFVRDLLLAAPAPLLRALTWGSLVLELAYAPLALLRRARPWIWTAMVAMHLGLMVLVDFAELSLGMLILHLFLFDPAWIPPRFPGRRDRVFYDGTCGLCHRSVRFLLAEDRAGDAFTFAPLQGPSFAAEVPARERSGLPDSLVVRTGPGEILTRSDAILYALSRLGGLWRTLAAVLRLLPRFLRDAAYDGVARIRYRLFGRAREACPLLPPDLRSRFTG